MKKKPNILFLMCDQLNAKVLGCYGGPVPTPNIDRLANEGALFSDATCPYPVCSPSRASAITGMYPHSHGIIHNLFYKDYKLKNFPITEEGIRNSDITTEKLLHDQGYDTHHYGKWHLLDDEPLYYPDMFLEHHGYADEMKEVFANVRNKSREEWMYWYGWCLPVQQSETHRKTVGALGEKWEDKVYAEYLTKMGVLELPMEQNFDVRVADHAIQAILDADDRPFMVTCSFNSPHDPNVVPREYYELFDPKQIRLPDNFLLREQRFEREWSREAAADLGEASVREFLRIYYAQVKLVDDQVGRILSILQDKGLLDETVILFTADHGDMAGGHGMIWKSTSAFYDEVVRIPMIIRYPPDIRPQVTGIAAGITDVMPTLLQLAGSAIPPHIQGRSLLPYLTQTEPQEPAPEFSFCERLPAHPGHLRKPVCLSSGSYMVRGKGWKYILYPDGEEYLYHLSMDPGEMQNLVHLEQYSEVLKELRKQLKEWQQRTGHDRTAGFNI